MADILAAVLNPANRVQKISSINPLDEASNFAEKTNSTENLMRVEPLPFMETLISYLITGSIDKLVLKFQNAGIVVWMKTTEFGLLNGH